MKLTDEQIKSFQALYERSFGIILDRKEAMESAQQLLGLIRLTYRRIPANYENEYELTTAKTDPQLI